MVSLLFRIAYGLKYILIRPEMQTIFRPAAKFYGTVGEGMENTETEEKDFFLSDFLKS